MDTFAQTNVAKKAKLPTFRVLSEKKEETIDFAKIAADIAKSKRNDNTYLQRVALFELGHLLICAVKLGDIVLIKKSVDLFESSSFTGKLHQEPWLLERIITVSFDLEADKARPLYGAAFRVQIATSWNFFSDSFRYEYRKRIDELGSGN